MRRACVECLTALPDGSGVCPACGSVGRVRHFDSEAAWQAARASTRAPRRCGGALEPRLLVPALRIAGVGSVGFGGMLVAVALSGSGPGPAMAVGLGAVVPIAWGLAFLALAARLTRRETP